MKTLISTITLAALLTACTTTPTGQRVPDVKSMAAVAREAAHVGTVVWLQKNPGDRATFQKVQLGLHTLIAAGTFNAADLTQLLQQLPVNELKDPQTGTLIVGAAVTLWDVYGQQLTSLDKSQVFATYILPVAKALADGFDAALGPMVTLPQTTPTVTYKLK